MDLYGHSGDHSAAEPGEVLASLLRYLGVPPDLVPEKLEDRASLWCDMTAGRRLLLILDNAARSEQGIPLMTKKTGRQDLLDKAVKDLAAKNVALSLHRLEKELAECEQLAHEQILGKKT